VSFLWRPIFCSSEEEAEGRLADIGDADTPYEFFQKHDPEKAQQMERKGKKKQVILRGR
jgi:hypothetical protein